MSDTKRSLLTTGAVAAGIGIVLTIGITLGEARAQAARLEKVEIRCETVREEVAEVKAVLARIEQKVDDIRNNGHKP